MFLHDAEFRTPDYERRHSDATRAQMGVWRWKGIQRHATRILEIICGKRVLDFGGADGPLGFGSVIADVKTPPAVGYMVSADGIHWKFHSMAFDVIFTSHTLEHMPPTALQDTLKSFADAIVAGGYLIVHVPACTCRRWLPANYGNSEQEPHRLSFTLFRDHTTMLSDRFAIDALLALAGFDIELAEYCGDDSILVIARKPC